MSNQITSLFLLTILLSACNQKEAIAISPNEKLLNFHSKSVYTMDDLGEMETKKYQKIMSDAFNLETDTIKYLVTKIYISYLRAATGCADYYGDISFKGDTINLLFKNKSDIVCTERDIFRVTYEIANNDRRNFILKKY